MLSRTSKWLDSLPINLQQKISLERKKAGVVNGLAADQKKAASDNEGIREEGTRALNRFSTRELKSEPALVSLTDLLSMHL